MRQIVFEMIVTQFSGTYLATGNTISNSTPIMAKVELRNIRKISHDLVGLSHRNYSTIAVRIGIHWVHLFGVQWLQHMFSNTAFDAVGTGENTGFLYVAVREIENNFFRMFLYCCQALAKSDVLGWHEAGHDF